MPNLIQAAHRFRAPAPVIRFRACDGGVVLSIDGLEFRLALSEADDLNEELAAAIGVVKDGCLDGV